MRRSVKFLGTAVFIVLLIMWGRSLKKDSRLTFKPDVKENNWEFNQVSARRDVGKDVWIISSDRVLHKYPVEEMSGINSSINGPSGLRTINAPNGNYDNAEKTLMLMEAEGIWERHDYPLTWKTQKAYWNQKDDKWSFPQGLVVSSDVYFLVCESAVVKNQNCVHMVNGLIRWWNS
jgi:hypothetical protein